MATLNWIGKEAVVNHHRQVPYRLLKAHADLSVGEDDGNASGNLLVQGDNLEALKALLPYYGGKVKCIYIDPPYNTGNEGWVYNDNVNSPQIRAWLEKTVEGELRAVGKEGEDLSRHDKWLCMMYPRLALLREFLTEDGAIFVSIDDNEVHHLRLIMDEIFGARQFIGTVAWQHSVQGKNDAKLLSVHHNYVVAYSRNVGFECRKLPRKESHNVNYANPDNDPRGAWRSGDVRSPHHRDKLKFNIVSPRGKVIRPPEKGWRWSKDTVEDKIKSGEIVFVDGDTRIVRKIYLDEQEGRVPESIWFGDDVGTTRQATAMVAEILADDNVVFDTPKPIGVAETVIRMVAGPDDLVMDSFAGSGTTGHAVLAMNKADGGNRKFILVEMDEKIATTITRERLARVVEGYHPGGDKKKPKVEGLGGGFRYASLGPTLFDEYGRFRTGEDKVTFAQLASHIYFTQTGEPLPKQVNGKRSPLIGSWKGTAYYLLYNGILGDKTPDGGNVLTRDVLAKLPPHPKQNAMGDAPRVVFGEACRLSESTLRANSIVFKQIPYQVEVG